MPTSSGKKRSGKDSKSKREISDAHVSDVRRAARDLSRVSDLYGGGSNGRLLATDICSDPKLFGRVKRALQKRHDKGMGRIGDDGFYRRGEHEWKVPLGVRLCLGTQQPLVWAQIVQQYPWAVVWRSPKSGKKLRKYFSTPISAIDFIATAAQYVDKHACVISRSVGYDIPRQLRGKIPSPWRWCPRCMTARRFKRRYPERIFYATRKEWNEEKERFQWVERKLATLDCPHCGCTNQDIHMRRSNQPWEVRRIKQGVRRVKRRR